MNLHTAAFDIYCPNANWRVPNQSRIQLSHPAPPVMTSFGWSVRMGGGRHMTEIPYKGDVYCNALMHGTAAVISGQFHEPKMYIGGGRKEEVKDAVRIDWLTENHLTLVFAFSDPADKERFLSGVASTGAVHRIGRTENEFEIRDFHEPAVVMASEFINTWVPGSVDAPPITPDEIKAWKWGKLKPSRVDSYRLSTAFKYHGPFTREESRSELFSYPHFLSKTDKPLLSARIDWRDDKFVPLVKVWQ